MTSTTLTPSGKTKGLATKEDNTYHKTPQQRQTQQKRYNNLAKKGLDQPTSRNQTSKTNKTPAGVRFGNHQTQRAEKESPPPPSCRIAILPILERSQEGRASGKKGVGGIPFLSAGTRKNENKQKKTKETDREATGPIANHPGPRSTKDLDPGVEVQ